MHSLFLETIVIGAGTYLIRAGSLSGGSRIKWPDWLHQWLSFVTPAVLGALLGPLLLLPANQWNSLLHNPALIATVPTAVAGWFSRNLSLTVAVGVGCFAILHYWI